MQETMSQKEIDDLLKQYLEPTGQNESQKNHWICEKCKKQYSQLKTEEERKTFIFGKHAVIKNQEGITSFGIFSNTGELIFKGATSKGITIICLKCGNREIMISR